MWEEPSYCFQGGESNLVGQQRGVRALHQVLKKYRGENIAIGTHGNMMILIMNYFDKRFNFAAWQQLHMPDIYKLSFHHMELIDMKSIWNGGKGELPWQQQ